MKDSQDFSYESLSKMEKPYHSVTCACGPAKNGINSTFHSNVLYDSIVFSLCSMFNVVIALFLLFI